MLWPLILDAGHEIHFAYHSFNWSNLASHNAGVTVVIVGISGESSRVRHLYMGEPDESFSKKVVDNINPYLLAAPNVFVRARRDAANGLSPIADGNGPLDGGFLLLETDEKRVLLRKEPSARRYIRRFLGSQEIIKGTQRWCVWIEDSQLSEANRISELKERIEAVQGFRENAGTRAKTAVGRPHRFAWINQPNRQQIAIPKVCSSRREYITADFMGSETVISNRACIVMDPDLFEFAIVSSRLHWTWIATVCVRLRTDLSYSGTIGWNNFPLPTVTEQNKIDLTKCAEDILLAREGHFPATIADLYDPENMPDDLRRAHDHNDEVLERMYIGRKFKNDSERLEKLFELYTKMVASNESPQPANRKASQS